MHRSMFSGLTALVMLLGPASLAHAQVPSCPVVSDAVASQALGTPVQGKAQSDLPAGLVLCDFIDPTGVDYGVSTQSGAFPPGAAGGAAALALMYVPQLPPEAQTQIDALSQAGLNVAAPGYQISSVSGVGDAALFVKSELVPGFFKDSLLVQHGSDGFSFDTDDTPDAFTKLSALAQAALGSL
jgi:hypothetical protein